MLYVNARFLTQPITGVQRYGIEVSLLLKAIYGEQIEFLSPSNIIHREIAQKLHVRIVGKHTGHLWEQLDLLHYLKVRGNPLLLCLGNTAPLWYRNKIVTIHDITFIRYPKTFSSKFLLFYKTVIPIIIRTSKHIFTVSEFSKDEICEYYKLDKKKCSVAYNAVSAFFHPEEPIKPRDEFFLTVSSVKENKNTLLPLKVFKELKERGYNAVLYVIGDLHSSSFRSFDLSEYEKSNNIRFVGRVSDEKLREYYWRAKAFIFPSFYEGFGIPPLEAQACGCPVMSSNASCMPEVLGNSVLYFNPTEKNDLVAKIVSLSKNDMELYRERGYKNVNQYSWTKSAEKYKVVIDSFL